MKNVQAIASLLFWANCWIALFLAVVSEPDERLIRVAITLLWYIAATLHDIRNKSL